MNANRFVVNARHRLLEQIVIPFFLLAARATGGGQTQNDRLIEEIRRKRYTILVIDDDDKFRKSFCFILKRKYLAQVEDVDSGLKAIAAVRSGKTYDLVITDIMMPEMTGTETYHELHRIAPTQPIIMMSAYSDSDEWAKADALGLTLLHKPVLEDALLKVLSGLSRE